MTPGQSLPDDLADCEIKPVKVVQRCAVFVLAVVVAKHLLIEITEQVEWFDADVRALQTALQETPEVLHSIRVDLPANVLDGVIYNLVLEFVQAIIGLKGIGKQRGTGFDVLADFSLDMCLAPRRDNGCPNLAATFKDAHHDGFILAASPGDLPCLLVGVHVAGETPNESFVRLNFPREFIDTPGRESVPDAVIEEPRSLLAYADSSVDFVRTDSVLAIDGQPVSG